MDSRAPIAGNLPAQYSYSFLAPSLVVTEILDPPNIQLTDRRFRRKSLLAQLPGGAVLGGETGPGLTRKTAGAGICGLNDSPLPASAVRWKGSPKTPPCAGSLTNIPLKWPGSLYEARAPLTEQT
jgi:hypothetical protein